MQEKNSNRRWVLNNEIKSVVLLGDPRVKLAQHIAWQPPKMVNHPRGTTSLGLEPDNYNRAVVYAKPCYIPDIRNQIWFKDPSKNGWVSLYYVSEQELPIYNAWRVNNDYWASWSAFKAVQPREYINPIALKARNTEKNYVKTRLYEERLHDQGYVLRLRERGVSQEYIDSKLGHARPLMQTVEDTVAELELDF